MIDIKKSHMFLFYRSDRDNASIGVKGCGYNSATDHYHWGPGERPFYLLYHVIEGTGVIRYRQNDYQISAGDTFLMYPGEKHSLDSTQNTKWAYAWVGFAGNDPVIFLEQMGFSPMNPVHRVGDSQMFQKLVESMYEQRGDSMQCASEMTGILFRLLSNLMQFSGTGTDNMIFYSAMEYIRRHSDSALSVREICKHVNVSRSWLFRLFESRMGKSPMQYLNDLRMNKAMNLLFYTEKTITEIATLCGFDDSLYFSRCFHNYTGLSPTKFRTMAQNDRNNMNI